MKTQTNKFRSLITAGLVGLTALVQGAQAQPNVGAAYFASKESKSSSQNQYVELDYATQLPLSTRLSGAMDFYDGEGYFGKTALDRSLDKGLGLRVQAVHGNELLSQTGAGLTYVLPTPEKTFAVVRYLPLWLDKDGKQVDDKQILGYYASVSLPKDVTFSSFGEVNVNGNKGPQWAYGEVELAKKLTDRLSVGANLQLNGQGEGKMTPEVVPRIAVRAKF